MNDNEVNKIIAEFMEIKPFYGTSCLCTMRESCPCCDEHLDKDRFNIYTRSLDSLVPVWEKLRYLPVFRRRRGKKGYHCRGNTNFFDDIESSADTIQEAAASATEKVILELKND